MASKLEEGDDFHHPFTPYDVQLQFMRTAYDVLDRGNGQVGILESPTGTVGQSLSLGAISLSLKTTLGSLLLYAHHHEPLSFANLVESRYWRTISS
jgi:Rad3-related DNA helicase